MKSGKRAFKSRNAANAHVVLGRAEPPRASARNLTPRRTYNGACSLPAPKSLAALPDPEARRHRHRRMSGGVDSAVRGTLVQREGYAVLQGTVHVHWEDDGDRPSLLHHGGGFSSECAKLVKRGVSSSPGGALPRSIANESLLFLSELRSSRKQPDVLCNREINSAWSGLHVTLGALDRNGPLARRETRRSATRKLLKARRT